ncbi:MAG: hypothetical protein LBH25_14865 [Fibromonadaceae bacterium]|jgi:hypothetical protein|nr:hypothetical protein [Fibromonadaceae bacterium]
MKYQTSAFSNGTNRNIFKNAIGNTSTSISFSDVKPYETPLPSNINVFSEVKECVARLEDSSVKYQAKYILSNIYLLLQSAYKKRKISNRLSQIILVQQEDKSVLMEWIFQYFRIGFLLESDKTYSSYFVVSRSANDELFMPSTQKLDVDTPKSIEEIVEYVLGNT